jgi:hypothetical protein
MSSLLLFIIVWIICSIISCTIFYTFIFKNEIEIHVHDLLFALALLVAGCIGLVSILFIMIQLFWEKHNISDKVIYRRKK